MNITLSVGPQLVPRTLNIKLEMHHQCMHVSDTSVVCYSLAGEWSGLNHMIVPCCGCFRYSQDSQEEVYAHSVSSSSASSSVSISHTKLASLSLVCRKNVCSCVLGCSGACCNILTAQLSTHIQPCHQHSLIICYHVLVIEQPAVTQHQKDQSLYCCHAGYLQEQCVCLYPRLLRHVL